MKPRGEEFGREGKPPVERGGRRRGYSGEEGCEEKRRESGVGLLLTKM